MPDKTHEMGISLLVMAGNKPAYGTTYQFLVNGSLVGNVQLVVEGRASAKISLPEGKSTIAVELRNAAFGVRLVPLVEKDITSEEKKKKEVAKLEVIGTVHDEKTFYITLARIDNTGKGKKGKVAYFDPNTADVKAEDTDDNGVAVINVDLGDSKQSATFFLPEKPGEKITKEIPVKKVAPQAPQPQAPKQPLADRLKEAYQRGRQG